MYDPGNKVLNAVDAQVAYDHLQAACRIFAAAGERQLEAMTSHVMGLVTDRFGVGIDDLSDHPDLPHPPPRN